MKRVTEQLTAYYRAAGLEGDDLSVAVAADVRRVKRQAKDHVRDGYELDAALIWSDTDEGYDYWEARNDADASV